MKLHKWFNKQKEINIEYKIYSTGTCIGTYSVHAYEIPTQELINKYMEIKKKLFKCNSDRKFIRLCEDCFSQTNSQIKW